MATPEPQVASTKPTAPATPSPVPPPAPAQPLKDDEEAYAHYHKVMDAVTKCPVRADSTLAALHQFLDVFTRRDATPEHVKNDKLLRNLTGVTEPAVRCDMFDKGKWRLSSPTATNGKYELFLRFNKLLYAPVVRLECRFNIDAPSPLCIQVVLEFHFGNCNGTELRNFEYIKAEERRDTPRNPSTCDRIKFQTNGATCTGLNNAISSEALLSGVQKAMLYVLRELAQSSVPRWLHFDLYTHELTSNFYTQELCDLHQIVARLPGGDTAMLSLGRPEYSAFRPRVGILAIREPSDLVRPNDLMRGRLPMVPLPCGDTFSSTTEGVIQLAYSAGISDAETRQALELWARARHSGTLFKVGHFPILALNYGYFSKLGSANQDLRYRLPRELHAELTFSIPGAYEVKYEGYLETEALGLRAHDAFFVITSHPVKWFEAAFKQNKDEKNPIYRDVRVKPHYNSFTYHSQLQTLHELQLESNSRWHPILLNQRHDLIPDHDLTAGLDIDPQKLEEAEKWLRGWREWNSEQLDVLASIHKAKGRMVITMGIAGTGKTLLQQALAIFFVKLGMRVQINAPANSNCNHFIRELEEALKEIKGARAYRLYCSSRNIGFKKMSQDQAKHRKVGHVDRRVSNLHGLGFKLHASRNQKTNARDYSFEQAVIDEADKGELQWLTMLDHNVDNRKEVEVWDVFRGHLNAARDLTLDRKDAKAISEFERSHNICTNHLIALTDIMVTTTGNARATEIVDVWANAERDFDISCKGYMVVMDEGPKDQEINSWNAVTALGSKVNGVMMFGDDKQLKPVNPGAGRKLQFNMFSERLAIPLPSRLVREGFQHVSLREQQRMHPVLSDFPSDEFYDALLRNAPRVHGSLDIVRPGMIDAALDPILRKVLSESEKARYTDGRLSEELYRLHYFEIVGERVQHPESCSSVVKEHVEVFFREMFPHLQSYFGDRTEEDLMIICGHGYAASHLNPCLFRVWLTSWQIQHYQTAVFELQAKQKNPDSHYPRIMTIDSAQGQEAFMVIVDGSFQCRDMMGFMTDPGRCNVAMTRAKGVLWVLGGLLGLKDSRHAHEAPSPFVKLKNRMQTRNQVHRLQ
ncbi:hypothetical protein LTR36_010119 [Oleoguttula mirabilis]|uniref:DNA2/NAM7 helicase-like C-terminal domain-containing protein n=1 Tax=Oleoguttula mirabilis TaxID=1507867 RepID=A0AAV9JUJ9_9PEZI|nr:hypothetical protein LTR36_010119 [Oleoguttula mirabilis]